MIKTAELCSKDVININDGRNLGCICDVEFDIEAGMVTGIFVPGNSKLFGLFSRGDDLLIPWERITKIGRDVILVDLLKVIE